jgi:hypothetical protein
MPLPTPKNNQEESDFIGSCMGSETMNKEYPNQKQRAAICYSQYKRKKKKSEGSMDEKTEWKEEDVSRVIIE